MTGEASFFVWLWPVWLLALPYAHSPDEVMLAIPLAAVLGQDARRLAERGPAFLLYLLAFSLWFSLRVPLAIQLTPIVPRITGAVLWCDSRGRTALAQ